MKMRGFTLLEMLLVIVIIASIMAMFVGYTLRKSQETMIDKTVLTMQQILNAGLAFYVDHGQWPGYTIGNGSVLKGGDGLDLMVEGYLPDQDFRSLWGNPEDTTTQKWGLIFYSERDKNKNFTVCLPVSASSDAVGIADTIAGRLPLGRTTQADYTTCGDKMEIIPCDGTTTCNVVTTVGVPAQNLNNARSVNFSGIYKNGGCVPVPVCPSGMVPQIMVSPVSVSGLYEGMNGTNGTSGDAIPLTSFTAYATGPADYSFDAQTGPDNCVNLATNPGRYCYSNLDVTSNPQVKEYLPDGRYWRVCLEIVTEKGKLAGSNWKMQSGSVMAITRCAPPEEPSGSNENVFEPY